jgi:hypothetical protein
MVGLAAGLIACATAAAAEGGQPAKGSTLFHDVNVLPMDRNVVLPHQSVLIVGDRIAAMGPMDTVRAPPGAAVVEGHGRYLLPGLVDFHTHPQAPEELTSDLAFGVTTVVAFDGEVVEWNRTGLRPPTVAAHMLGTTHILEGVSAADNAYAVKDPRDASDILDHEQRLGADFVKTYSHMTLPEFRALVREGHARGMPIVGHIPIGLPQQDVLGSGLDLVAHSEEFKRYLSWNSSDADYASVIDRVAQNRIAVVGNLAAVHEIERQATALPQVMADTEVGYLSSTAYQGWLDRNNDYSHRPNKAQWLGDVRSLFSLMQKVVKKLDDAGVLLLMGTDAPVDCVPGLCVHEELGLLSAAGLSNFDVLRSATFNAGVFVTTESRNRALDRFGVVAPGANADLLLAPTNPLDDLSVLRRVDGVMVDGVWRTAAELSQARQALLPELQRRHALVDQYESLVVAKDFDRLDAFLDATPANGAALLSDQVVARDAAALAAGGDLDHAVGLLSRAKHLTGDSFRVYNELGRVLVLKGDRRGAVEQFRQSLVIAPHNAGAALGLEGLGLSDEDGQ